MSLVKEFIEITNEYDNKLFEKFKIVIDQSILETKELRLDGIDSFIYIITKLEEAYIKLALAIGIVTEETIKADTYFRINPPISEKLTERIYTYLEPVTVEAQVAIKLLAEQVTLSTSVTEMQENYNRLNSILNNKTITENPYLIDELDIGEGFTYKKDKIDTTTTL
jgi:hypothetical protein